MGASPDWENEGHSTGKYGVALGDPGLRQVGKRAIETYPRRGRLHANCAPRSRYRYSPIWRPRTIHCLDDHSSRRETPFAHTQNRRRKTRSASSHLQWLSSANLRCSCSYPLPFRALFQARPTNAHIPVKIVATTKLQPQCGAVLLPASRSGNMSPITWFHHPLRSGSAERRRIGLQTGGRFLDKSDV
jgi:hypothetical protein